MNRGSLECRIISLVARRMVKKGGNWIYNFKLLVE